jgi:hypothetical protein
MNMRGQLYVPAALLFGKEPLVANEYEGGPESWSGERERCLFTYRNRTTILRLCSP